MSIECFFENHQHTFTAIGAIATAMAVWIALRQNKPKMKVYIQKAVYIPPLSLAEINMVYRKGMLIKDSDYDKDKKFYDYNKEEYKEYLIATVTNIGNIPIKLFSYSFSFSSWEVSNCKPFIKRRYRKLYDMEGIQKYPCSIEIGETTEFILEDLNIFRQYLKDLELWRYFWSFNVFTGWVNFKSKFSKSLSEEVKNNLKRKK